MNAAIKLHKQKERLISGFLKGKEPAFPERHAQILDEYFCESYADSQAGPKINMNNNAYAMIALGGYGRSEQCFFSDVDLLILFEKKVPKEAAELIEEVVYPLWDLKLEVGYSTLSVRECVRMAAKEFETLTALLDARFICGMSPLYSELIEAIQSHIISKRGAEIIAWIVKQNRLRHQRFGDSSYLLAPNLKEGQGGLRDYHTMLWLARLRSNIKVPRDLEFDGYMSQKEFQSLSKAVAFIWRVRNRLHHLVGRKNDQLHFEYQRKLAAGLKFKNKKGQSAVEVFLGALHGQMEYIKQLHLMFIHELDLIRSRKRKSGRVKETVIKGLKVEEDMLYFSSSRAILKNPDLLIAVFEESARLKIPLSAEAKRLVKEFSYLATRHFRTSTSVVASFEKILVKWVPTFNVLNEMLQTGILLKFIPEMKRIVNRIQYDEYHLYPVDKHVLRTVQALKGFGATLNDTPDPLCRELYLELKNKKPLLWAALLHDIGKGELGDDHSCRGARVVRNILTSKGIDGSDIETAVFLVQNHLMLIKTATRRDIADEETAIFCARQIESIERLKMLYLLTVADSVSTGPKAWNEWTAALLRDFFLKVLSILEKGELATHEAVEQVENKKEKIMLTASTPQEREDLDALFNVMSPRYLLYTSSREIIEHIKLYQSIGSSGFVWKVDRVQKSNTREVTVCAHDRPGLFSKIAGVFTLNGLDILDVKVYTWRNNIALDIFRVTPPPDQIFEDQKWFRAQEDLRRAMSERLDLNAAMEERRSGYSKLKPRASGRPPRIVVDNQSSSFFTIVEVFAYDFTGLLFYVTDALFKCRLDIWVAKIATKVDQVVDVFYVRDFDGQKVDSPDQVSAMKTAIENVLSVAQ